MKEIKVCSFFGHRDCKLDKTQKLLLRNIIEDLIINHGVREFLFGEESSFDKISYDVCLDLKMEYPYIYLICVRAKYPSPNLDYIKGLLEWFDDTYCPKVVENSGKGLYITRNMDMINKSDYCVFYIQHERVYSYRTKYGTGSMVRTNSGTKIAYDYAKSKNKEIIEIN